MTPFRQNPLYWRDRVIAAVQPAAHDILVRRAYRWERIRRLREALDTLRAGEEARGVFLLPNGQLERREAVL